MKQYPSYKDSGVEWIGEIPSHWVKVKPYSLFRPVKREPAIEDDIITCFRDGVVTLRKNRREDGFTMSSKEIGYQRIMKNDLVIHEMDGFEGSIGVSDSMGKSTPVYTVIPSSKNHNNRFWMYLLRVMSKTGYIESLSRSIRERTTEFRWNMWKNVLFPTPPLPEQHQIVSFLDNKTSLIDKLIDTKKRKIELLKEYRTTLINQVVTKGLNPNVEMKDSGVEWIGEIPSHWEKISIKHLVTTPITDGPHVTPTFIDDGEIPFLSVEGVVGNTIDFNKVRGYISKELHRQYTKKCKPQRDDVLLVKSGSTTGKSTIVETDLEFNIWSPLCIIRSNQTKIIPRFTFLTFQSGYFILFIENNWSYGTQPNIGMGVIENLRIVVPPISEQHEIVSYLDEKTSTVDTEIGMEERKIELLKEYRQSLISEVVTGKIKVTNDE